MCRLSRGRLTQGDGSFVLGCQGYVKGTVLLTTFESKHLEKQPSAVQNGIHLTPVVKGTVLLTTGQPTEHRDVKLR